LNKNCNREKNDLTLTTVIFLFFTLEMLLNSAVATIQVTWLHVYVRSIDHSEKSYCAVYIHAYFTFYTLETAKIQKVVCTYAVLNKNIECW